MPALNLDSILLRSWWSETPLNCAGTLQMDTWKPNKRNGCELPWQHFSRKWPGVCILADYTHNRSSRGVLHQSCVSKRRSRSTLTDPVCKEAEQYQRGTLRSPRGWGRERWAESTAHIPEESPSHLLSHRIFTRDHGKIKYQKHSHFQARPAPFCLNQQDYWSALKGWGTVWILL